MSDNQALLDSLLDGTLDDLQDLPSNAPFAPGAHVVTIKFEAKTVNEKLAVELECTMVETQELSNPEDTPPKAGDKANVLFMMGNELGEGNLKKVLAPLAEATGTTGQSKRAVFEAVNGMTALVVTTKRSNKDKTAEYMDVKSITLL